MRTWIAPVAALPVLLSAVSYTFADALGGSHNLGRLFLYYCGVPLLVIGGMIALLVFLAGLYARRKDD